MSVVWVLEPQDERWDPNVSPKLGVGGVSGGGVGGLGFGGFWGENGGKKGHFLGSRASRCP